jgi:ABC-type Zn uptake system ZnuABC Zn-binding protein ZnuA
MRPQPLLVTLAVLLAVAACAPAGAPATPRVTAPPGAPVTGVTAAIGTPRVLATETFLADITRNVAGDRLAVTALLPIGVDPHAFEPTPADVRKVEEADVLVINGAGVEGYLTTLLATAGGNRPVIEAARGLPMRQARPGELPPAPGEAGDPHFWLDPVLVMDYVTNIRDGLTRADPAGAAVYAANAEAYQQRLADLDTEIRGLLGGIPENERLLVTNHESLGYFADRYGFRVVGTVIPSASTDSSPSARQLADLVDHIRASGAKAIFLETGANPQLARQVAAETGAQVVTDLYTHSITGPDGPAPTYIDMMRANARAIANALGSAG